MMIWQLTIASNFQIQLEWPNFLFSILKKTDKLVASFMQRQTYLLEPKNLKVTF